MRLITFGCSYTQGVGLEPHMHNPDPEIKSKLAWPALMGEKMGCEVVNNGVGGSCNKQITYSIMNFNYCPGDIVIVLWAYPTRHSILVSRQQKNGYGSIHGAAWEEYRPQHEPIDNYFRYIFRNDCDSNYVSDLLMNQAHLYLNSLGIENYHCNSQDHTRKYSSWLVPEMHLGLRGIAYALEQGVPETEIYALDGSHLGPWFHEEFAQRMVDNHFFDAIINIC